MKRMPSGSLDQTATTANVVIHRPVNEVFGFYRNFENLPKFLGDVMKVEQIDPATSRWTIQGPLGIRTQLKIRVTEESRNEFLRYETVTVPILKTQWEIRFIPLSPEGETGVSEIMRVPLRGLGLAALALMGKFPAEEVSANLNRLKELLEPGKVTNKSYAVPGKFA